MNLLVYLLKYSCDLKNMKDNERSSHLYFIFFHYITVLSNSLALKRGIFIRKTNQRKLSFEMYLD